MGPIPAHLTSWARLHSVACIIAGAGWLVWFTLAGAPPLYSVIWAAGVAGMALTPRQPAFGPAFYVATLYGTPRYSDLHTQLFNSHALDAQVALAVAGGLLWSLRLGRTPSVRNVLVRLALVTFGWFALSALRPAPEIPESIYYARHAAIFFLHAFVLLMLASQVMGTPASVRAFILPVAVCLAIRIGWQGPSGVWLEGDIGPLAVMMLPLLLLVASADSNWSVRVFAMAGALGAVGTVGLTYNRASAVALACVLCLLLWRHRRNAMVLALSGAMVVAAALWLRATPYWTRFQQAGLELMGASTGSVTERFRLWETALRMVQDHPWLGVGLTNYSALRSSYVPGSSRTVAHNSYLQVAAETGIPGLCLYVLLFGAALVLAARVARRDARAGPITSSIAISLCGYLVAGLFISRHDMVLAYVLVGWVAALATAPGSSLSARLTTPLREDATA